MQFPLTSSSVIIFILVLNADESAKEQCHLSTSCEKAPDQIEETHSTVGDVGIAGVVGADGRKKKRTTPKKISRKKRRNAGETYVGATGKITLKRQLKPGCTTACKRKCRSIFSDAEREAIFVDYWNLPAVQKKDFVLKHMKKGEKNRTTTPNEVSRRKFSRTYHLPKNGEAVQVCKTFFMATLDIKAKFLRYTEEKSSQSVLNSARNDERGTKNSVNKTPPRLVNGVRKFIQSLPAVDSHYCRNSSQKKYLPESYESLNNVYRMYEQDCSERRSTPVSFWVFKRIFRMEYNIGIHLPKKDKCDVCVKFAGLPFPTEENVQEKNEHDTEKNAINKKYVEDQKKAEENNKFVTCSFDLQKVLQTPHGKSILFFYVRKYAMYNSTFYESNTRNVICFMWGECDGKRGSNEIVSIVEKYLTELDDKKTVVEVSFYSDNCTGQQKNKAMCIMMNEFSAKAKHIQRITLNFLMVGHSLMTVDSAHAVIERASRKKTIYAPSEWLTVVSNARYKPFPYVVKKMTYSDFLDWHTYADSKHLKLDDKSDLKITEIRAAIFEKKNAIDGHFKIIKSALNFENYERVSVIGKRKRNNVVVDLKPAYNSRVPLSKVKYDDLMKLCEKGAIPSHLQEEYFRMPYSENARDCLAQPDEDENSVDDPPHA